MPIALASACSQQSTATQLRSLQTSGEMSFICLSREADGVVTRGEPRELCPDFETLNANQPEHRRLHALVTQPETGEIALVDLFAENAIDAEPTQPGYNFLPVGGQPTAIVSTPGGQASFVAVQEPGREGIFGLPTSCIGPRPEPAAVRDITTWPACRLPTAPGALSVVLDRAVDDDANAVTPPLVRERCEAEYEDPEALVGRAPGATRELCPADLALESSPPGRRKLLVALPAYGEVWLLDAQELLDRAPGSFDACVPEQRLALSGSVPSDAPQTAPPDVAPPGAMCSPVGVDFGQSGPFTPRPVDFAVDEEQRVYVADSAAPLIHVLDATEPCALSPLAPLLPTSYLQPTAPITTSKVAVSRLTAGGQRFVYAIDDSVSSTAGSLIPFDVSPNATERTPILRQRSSWTPLEPPDRIVFPQDVSDVEFVSRDVPVLQDGVGIEGIACEPNPVLTDTLGARYRPTTDRLAGASPRRLRGTFALASLHSGRIGVVDVEDLDAACRRPIIANTGAEEDISGCSGDDATVPNGFYALPNNIPTVSSELSCNVVAPHRVRSQTFFINSLDGSRAGAVRSFPTLALETGRAVATDQSAEGRNLPRMLGAWRAPAEEGPAVLVVGDFGYSTADPSGERLELDPTLADRSSLLLSFEEPRAFISGEDFVATYEGVIGAVGRAYLVPDAEGFLRVDDDVNGAFCDGGVQDFDAIRAVGVELGVREADLDAFARQHADYVQIVSELLDENDVHWAEGSVGATCGAELFQRDDGTELAGRAVCEDFFGAAQLQNNTRDLRILRASETELVTEPRIFDPTTGSSERRRQISELVACCFPQSVTFGVRAGRQWVVQGAATGFAHHVVADPSTGRCVNDCNPLRRRLTGRVFEITCSGECETPAGENVPVVGLAQPDRDFACVVDSVAGGIEPGEPGAECVFQSLTTRFAIYRGRLPSTRNMRFRWQLAGGFQPFLLNLTSIDRISSPRSLFYTRDLDRLFMADGAARGLSFISLRNFSLDTIF